MHRQLDFGAARPLALARFSRSELQMTISVLAARVRRVALIVLLWGVFPALIPLSSFAAGTVTLAWDPSSGTNIIARYSIYFGAASRTYTNTTAAGTATTLTISNLVGGRTYYFAATAVDTSGLESDYSAEVSTLIPVNATNRPPTLNLLVNVAINESAGLQTVNLSGITSGATNEVQTLTVTASSSNPSLIPTPTVSYTSPSATGSISFTPVALAFGSATITVTVNDGAASNNIISRTFTVTVNPVNQAPTLNTLANLTVNENAGPQGVSLSGITSGAANEAQTLAVTAASSNPSVIANPTVSYASPNNTGTLTLSPVANAFGSATITVTVNDGGSSNNVVSRTFTVTVNPVNQPPTLNSIANLMVNANAGPQTVNLSGITSGAANEAQTLTVTSTSSSPGLIATPTVSYTSPNATGVLTFSPVANASGTATLTVTVNDGGTSNNVVSRSFTVTVNPANQPPTLNPVANLTINENAGLQTVNLYGISSGGTNEGQTLTVTATSSNPGLIPTPAVSYTSPSNTASLAFTPVASTYGSATITVTVNDGGASNNVVSRSFLVTVVHFDPRPTCTYALSLSPTGFTANASSGTFSVTTGTNCVWSIVAPSWVSLSSTNGSGDLSGTFIVDANTNISRTGLVSVTDGATEISCTITQQAIVSGAVALITPPDGATFQGRRPQFSWSQSDHSATWYYLWVTCNGGKYFDLWIEGETNWTANFDMPGANYAWWVLPWSPAGYGAWSQRSSFTIPLNVPVAVTLVAPAGNVASASAQRYTWKADQAAIWYELYISKDGQFFFDRWFTLTNSVVDLATGNFAVDVTGHGPGAYQWWVRGWSPDGCGPWSSAGGFTIGAVALLAPSNSAVLQTRQPQLSWSQSDPVATWFRLYINRDGSNYLDQWIESTTNWTAIADMSGGDYTWWVQSWSPAGYGPWSGGGAFTIQTAVPDAITLISPAGSVPGDVTQRYTWKLDPAATWYELYILKNGQAFYDQWFTSTNSLLDTTTGKFAVEVSGHGLGAYQWYVRGWSLDGHGLWSSGLIFRLP